MSVEFRNRAPLYRIGLHILAVDAMHLSAKAPTQELSDKYFRLTGMLHNASKMSEGDLVRYYDELLVETTGATDVAAMDTMMLIDLVLDTRPMPSVTA